MKIKNTIYEVFEPCLNPHLPSTCDINTTSNISMDSVNDVEVDKSNNLLTDETFSIIQDLIKIAEIGERFPENGFERRVLLKLKCHLDY